LKAISEANEDRLGFDLGQGKPFKKWLRIELRKKKKIYREV